eukprot:UN23830
MSDTTRQLTLDNLRDFLLNHNGKIRRSSLPEHFPDLTSSDETTKMRTRKQFREISNLITFSKKEHGTDYIYLNEQYRSNVAYKNANLKSQLSFEKGDEKEEDVEGLVNHGEGNLLVPGGDTASDHHNTHHSNHH